MLEWKILDNTSLTLNAQDGIKSPLLVWEMFVLGEIPSFGESIF